MFVKMMVRGGVFDERLSISVWCLCEMSRFFAGRSMQNDYVVSTWISVVGGICHRVRC